MPCRPLCMHFQASRPQPIRPGSLAISPSLPENEALLNTVKPETIRRPSLIVANSYFRGKVGECADVRAARRLSTARHRRTHMSSSQTLADLATSLLSGSVRVVDLSAPLGP